PSYEHIICSSNFGNDFPAQILKIEAAQYWAPLMYSNNRYYRDFLRKYFPSKYGNSLSLDYLNSIDIFGPIGNFLLKLNPNIEKKILYFKKKFFKERNNTYYIGVHIRKNLYENLFVNMPVELFWK